ncbi:MAG: ribonuclease HII [Pseudomonadota bacterium]
MNFSNINVHVNDYVGIDEAGRGPLAGPVVAAAVVLGDKRCWSDIQDSKAISPIKREHLADEIKQSVFAWSIGRCDVEEIDQYNIFNASLLAMQRAFNGINLPAKIALVDGKFSPELTVTSYAIIKGDNHVPAISAASILAKVTRDLEMTELDKLFPDYGFAQHKGYPTRQHLAALKRYGACSYHRKSFKPVTEVI